MILLLKSLIAMAIMSIPVGGICIMICSYQSLYLSIQSKKWPRALAKVTHYELDTYTTGGQSSETKYAYTNICIYEVQGISYVNRDSRHNGFQTLSAAETAASRLCPVGQSLKIFYNPQEPVRSTLSPGWNWQSFGGILFGILLTAFSSMHAFRATLYILSTE
jgi:hypothetical protein